MRLWVLRLIFYGSNMCMWCKYLMKQCKNTGEALSILCVLHKTFLLTFCHLHILYPSEISSYTYQWFTDTSTQSTAHKKAFTFSHSFQLHRLMNHPLYFLLLFYYSTCWKNAFFGKKTKNKKTVCYGFHLNVYKRLY